MITETPTVVPLIERLRRIPKKHKVSIAFQWAEDGTATGYSSIPVGYLMHTAADELAKLREELAEAKVCISNQESMLNGKNEYVGQDFKMRMQKLTQRAEQAEARALAAEKDAGRYRFLCEGDYQDDGEMWTAISNTSIKDEWDAEIDAAIGAKHD